MSFFIADLLQAFNMLMCIVNFLEGDVVDSFSQTHFTEKHFFFFWEHILRLMFYGTFFA